jgi:hypothetical protein
MHRVNLIDAPDSEFAKLHTLRGYGHEGFVHTKDLIEAYWSQGGLELADVCDFKSPRVQGLVKDGWNNHKMKQLFLEIGRPAFTDMFLNQWRTSGITETDDPLDMDAFAAWGKRCSQKDKHFENQ